MRRWARKLGGVLLVAVFGSAPAGCYHHVIRSEGLGQGPDEVYQPNREPDAVDEWMWGESATKEKKR